MRSSPGKSEKTKSLPFGYNGTAGCFNIFLLKVVERDSPQFTPLHSAHLCSINVLPKSHQDPEREGF